MTFVLYKKYIIFYIFFFFFFVSFIFVGYLFSEDVAQESEQKSETWHMGFG